MFKNRKNSNAIINTKSVRKKNCCESCMTYLLKTNYRRLLLPLIIFLFLIPFEPFKDIINYTYFPIVSGLGGFIIFINFPFLAYITASKPLYYEDLFIDEKKLPNYNIDSNVKDKYQCILLWVLIITNSILVGALSDYWLYKTTSNYNSFLQIIGITGGIIKIFQIVNNTVGRILLKIIKKEIVEETNKFEENQKKKIEEIVNLKIKDSINRDNVVIEMTETNKNIALHSP